MTRPEHLAALIDLGYNEQESRFLYLVATHSGYFTLRQFLDYTGTAKGRNVHEFTSKSIRLEHVRAATCGYRTSVFNLFSRKVYGALDRDNLRNRRRLSSELIQTRLLILDFVLTHPGLEYLETEAEKVAYFRELAVPEALIPGRVYKGIDPNSTTKRCFVDRFPVFFSAESDCPPGERTPTFIAIPPTGASSTTSRTFATTNISCGSYLAFSSSMPPQARRNSSGQNSSSAALSRKTARPMSDPSPAISASGVSGTRTNTAF